MINRSLLRSAYDAAVAEIVRSRPGSNLTNGFYSRISNSVFDACYSALMDAADGQEGSKRLHIVSAPMGSGKTTFSIAFMVAVTRLADTTPELSSGCVLLVDQMTKAEKMFGELNALLPGQVAVWTTDHDVKCTEPTRVVNPTRRFAVEELCDYPVVIVTHKFYKGARGSKAKRYGNVERALTIIDEQLSEEIKYFETSHAQAAEVLERALQHEAPSTATTALQALVDFMWDRHKSSDVGSLEKPTDAPEAWNATALAWFASTEAHRFALGHKAKLPHIEMVFGFGKAVATGYAFLTRKGEIAYFVGYEGDITTAPGMVLLDATVVRTWTGLLLSAPGEEMYRYHKLATIT